MVLPAGQTVAVTASGDGMVRVWDLAAGTLARELAGHTGAVYAVACMVLPAGQIVAVTCHDDDTVRVWDLLGGGELPSARLYLPGSVRGVAVAADGTVVLVGAGVVGRHHRRWPRDRGSGDRRGRGGRG